MGILLDPATCPINFGFERPKLTRLFDAAAVEVGLDLQPRPAAEACAIDLQILHDPLHVVPGFREPDQLGPIGRIDVGIARVAVAIGPFFDAGPDLTLCWIDA